MSRYIRVSNLFSRNTRQQTLRNTKNTLPWRPKRKTASKKTNPKGGADEVDPTKLGELRKKLKTERTALRKRVTHDAVTGGRSGGTDEDDHCAKAAGKAERKSSDQRSKRETTSSKHRQARTMKQGDASNVNGSRQNTIKMCADGVRTLFLKPNCASVASTNQEECSPPVHV